jgi:putative endonuclease
MRAKDALGRHGEDLAVRHLEHEGITVLERNWRCALGELDVIARDGDALVVCEVKTRRSTAYGSPVEAVTARKARRLRRLALQWLDERQVFAPTIRFDVIGVLQPLDGAASIVHVRGID